MLDNANHFFFVEQDNLCKIKMSISLCDWNCVFYISNNIAPK